MAFADQTDACEEHQQFLLYKLDSMRTSQFMTDVTIVCQGEEFVAHGNVLCAASPFFRGMFQSKFKETLSGKVTLSTISAVAAKTVLDFMYVGQMPSTNEHIDILLDLLHASHLLQLNILFQFCLHHAVKNISERRFLRILQIIDLYDENGYLDQIIQFLADHFFQISSSNDFFNVDIAHLKLLLLHPTLRKYPTDYVLERTISWVKFNQKERLKKLDDLLLLVDVEEISLRALNNMLNDPFIKQYEAIYNRFLLTSFDKVTNLCFEAKLLCFGYDENLTRTMVSYDVKRKMWFEHGSLPPSLDINGVITAYHNCVYFVGGVHGGTQVFKYSLLTKEVAELDSVQLPVYQAGATGYNEHIYVIGGIEMEGGFSAVKHVQRIHCNTGTNEPVCPSTDAHHLPTVFTFRDCLYVIGSQDNVDASLEQYDCLADQWTTVTRIPGDVKWCKACVCRDTLIVVPKEEIRHSQNVLVYDLSNDTWEMKDVTGGPRESLWDLQSVYNKYKDKTIIFAMGDNQSLFIYDYSNNAFINVFPKNPNPSSWQGILHFCIAYA